MIPRNGFCLSFVILCFTVNYVVDSAKSTRTTLDEEQAKDTNSKIKVLQNKLELLSDKLTTSTKKPTTSRPTYRPLPPMYWPPYPPPPYYPPPHYPPPQHYPPPHHPPSTRPTKPTKRPGHHPPRQPIRDLCKIPANRNLIVCQKVCQHYPDISICLPICSLDQYKAKSYCDPDCIASKSVGCSLPSSANVVPPNGCSAKTELVTECALYCLTYTDDDDLYWCETQLEQLAEADDDDRQRAAYYTYGYL